MRQIIDCPDYEEKNYENFKSANLGEIEVEIEFLTPFFGGGTKAGETDSVTPVRASSIRGHLRFWWRATRGASFPNSPALKQREDEVWGSTDKPSPVQIEVTKTEKRGKRRFNSQNCFGFDRYGPEAYALFSAQSNENDLAKEGLSFSLKLTWPKDKDITKDIKAALWAWVNFGGLGARTRRGLGALWCKNGEELFHAENFGSFESWLNEKIKEFDIPSLSGTRDWPLLPRAFYIKQVNGGALNTWQEGLKMMKIFRQGPKVGRDPGRGNRPGRSRWPEAESIREIAVEQNHRSRADLRLKSQDRRIPTEYFPRAEFGLPIIFEIIGENLKPTLVPGNGIERMASPVIIRPIRFSDNNHAALIYFLATPPLNQALLTPGDKDKLRESVSIEADQIRSSVLTTYPDSPMKGRTTSGSALEAFMTYITNNGFQEVAL